MWFILPIWSKYIKVSEVIDSACLNQWRWKIIKQTAEEILAKQPTIWVSVCLCVYPLYIYISIVLIVFFFTKSANLNTLIDIHKYKILKYNNKGKVTYHAAQHILEENQPIRSPITQINDAFTCSSLYQCVLYKVCPLGVKIDYGNMESKMKQQI